MATGAFDRRGSEFLVNTATAGAQTASSIAALSSGGFIISWTDASGTGGDASGTSIKAQRYDASGNPIGSEFLVNTATLNAQQSSTTTALAGGGFVISWTDLSNQGDSDSSGVKAQIYDAAGNRVGGEFLVNTVTAQGQGNQSISGLATGGFVITWTDASGLAPDNKGTGIKGQLYSATGAKVGGEFLVNTTILGSQQFSTVTALTSGAFVVSWTDGSLQGGDNSVSSIKAQLFSAGGAKIGSEFLVNTVTAQQQDQSSIAALSGGGFVVTWRDVSLQDDRSGSGVKAQIYNGAGQKVGGEFLVNTQIVNTQDSPTVTGLADGGFAISWRDNSLLSSDPSSFGVRIQIFDALGNRIGGEFQANTTTLNSQEQPRITGLASGEIVVSWTDYSQQGADASGASIKAQIFNPSQQTITTIGLSSAAVYETSVENLPVATIAANGALNAVYQYELLDDSTGGAFRIDGSRLVVANSLKLDFETSQSASVTVRATDNFGNSFVQTLDIAILDASIEARYTAGPDTLVNTTTAANQSQASVAALASGGYVVTWTDASLQGGDASGNGIKAQLYDASGVRLGGEIQVNTNTALSQDNSAAAALTSGGFVVAWADATGDASGSGVKVQVYDAAGLRVGGESLVNTTTAGAQTAPAVATLAGGGFVVTWTDASQQGSDTSSTGVKAQLFDALGARVGGEIAVNSSTLNGQDSAVVTGLEAGGFVISWRDNSGQGGDSSKDSVKAQLFDATGAKVGAEVLVNTETNASQQAPAIAALDTGGYVITWTDSSQRSADNDYYAVKAQIFSADGSRFGDEVLVNTTTPNGQLQPTVTALSFGGFVVSWADYSGLNSELGTAGIKGQLFDDFGQRVSGEFAVNTETAGIQAEPTVTLLREGGFVVGWTDYSGSGGDATGTSIKTKLFAPLPGQGPPPHILTGVDTLDAVEDQPAQFLAASLTLNDLDASNSPLTVTAVSAISGGSVVLNPDGTIDFVPLANFSGRASFNYTVVDTEGFSAVGRANINVAGVNDAPVGVDDSITISQNGGPIAAGTLLANDVNVDPGDTLRITEVSATSAAGFALSLAGGIISYAPGAAYVSLGAGQTASDSFSYTVADTAGLTSTALVTITIAGVNDAPVNLQLAGSNVDENAANGTVVGTLAAFDPDSGDTLTYVLTGNAGGRFTVDPVTGVVSVANGSLLDFETAAMHQITGRAIDAAGLFVESSFVITLNNLPEFRSYTGDNGTNIFTASTNDFWTIFGLGGNDTLNGNASADNIYGGSGADTLDGRGGADYMAGGTGNDVYFVDNSGDIVFEAFGEGTDLVNASVSFTLGTNIENLTLIGTGNINGTGNDLNNTMNGNDGDNTLSGGLGRDFLVGGGGRDLLIGGDGADWLQGGDGDDTLIGGAGADELTGGAGSDMFVFDSLTISTDRDVVKDFTHGTDKLAISQAVFTAFAGAPLGDISASAFVLGSQAVTADQHLIYNASTGALFYDPDGVGGVAQIQIALTNLGAGITATDFIIIA